MNIPSRLAAATLCLTPVPATAQATFGTTPNRAPAAPIATTYPATAGGDGATSNGYNLSRWAEDWSSYRDPAKRDDILDRLKFLPLDGDGDVFLTLSGELRLRVNETTNPGLRDARAQRQDINRITAGADLHIGPHIRAFAELAHGGISGVELGAPSSSLRNAFVVQQLFVEGTAAIGGVALGARYGRQEFTDGPNILISQRDNNTIRYTLNGIRAWARGKTVRIDLFDLKPTLYGGLGPDDDVIDPARRFSGVTFGVVVPPRWFDGSKLYLDPFFWRRRNDVGAWGGRIGPAERFYAGARLWGDVGRWTIDWTVNHQFGTYIDQRIVAWQMFIAQTWRVAEDKAAPRVGLHVDYASGGGGYGEGKLRDSYAPFGNNIYYSYALFLTPSNLIAAAPNVAIQLARAVRLTVEYMMAWRDSTTDAVYRANGQPYAGTQRFGRATIGGVSRLQLIWALSPRVSLTGRYEHLAAGPALTDAGFKSSDFLAGWASFRF